MSLEPVLDFFTGDPLAAATLRIARRLTVDGPALRLLRRASARRSPEAVAVYAWALGAMSGSEATASPVAMADVAAEAADLDPDNAAVQVGLGLAHIGSFGGRRATPLSARRAFSAAARLDAGNALPHLLLAAARFGTGDDPGAERSLDDALAAPEYRYYPGPLAEPLEAEAPWLAWPLAMFWPDRIDAAVRYCGESLVRHRRWRQTAAIALHMVRFGPRRVTPLLRGVGLGLQALGAMATSLHDDEAATARLRLSAIATRVQEEQRALSKKFEESAGGLLRSAGAGAGAGVLTGVIGWLRSRRRWPPPFPMAAMTVPGRVIATGGLLLTLGSAGLALTDNGPARLRRRALERDLLAQEQSNAASAAEQVREILAPWADLS